ncbi:PDZ domain containing 3b isoform X2 [Hypomesus transpacificus]|nr:PDZ domain containing 3b isoform X2 [Hypomesus transpacificus]
MISDDTESVSAPMPRLCALKRQEGESFGFHLRVERGRCGHVIRKLTAWGVAERSGLRDGDRLLEVNESFVDDIPHVEVARRILLSGNQLCLLVMDGEEYDQAVSQGLDLRSLARNHRGEDCQQPRMCHITRDTATGLGINFVPVEGQKGRFTVNLVSGGSAHKAGVFQGDHLVWMNGANVSELTNSALSKMVMKCKDHMTILVIDSESEKSYVRRRMPILPAMVGAHNLPHTPQRLHLVLGSKGYGFLLRQEKTPSGKIVHVMRGLDRDSPAEKAGLQEGDILLEVNRDPVESLEHGDIVDRVRQSGQVVTLTCITAQGLHFYTQLGLCPLLFCGSDPKENEGNKMVPPKPVRVEAPEEVPSVSSQRLCVLQKGPLGFGFNLGCDPQTPGTFISQVVLGGSGHRAGLKEGDLVIEVNGQGMEDKYIEDVIMLVKEGGHFLSLLVMEKSDSSEQKNTQQTTEAETEKYDSQKKEAEELLFL